MHRRLPPAQTRPGVDRVDKYTDGAAVGGSKFPAAASKVAGAPMESCQFVSMDATAKPSFSYGSQLSPAPVQGYLAHKKQPLPRTLQYI